MSFSTVTKGGDYGCINLSPAFVMKGRIFLWKNTKKEPDLISVSQFTFISLLFDNIEYLLSQ